MPNTRTKSIISGRDRARFGCIVSFENADGQTLTLHRVGAIKHALAAACDDALSLDETFRVVSYSTPETIHTDMTGGRRDVEMESRLSQRMGWSYAKTHPVPLPEAQALALVGRRHLLHPRLDRYVAKDTYKGWDSDA